MVSVATLNVVVFGAGLLGVVVACWGIFSSLIELVSLNAYSMNGARRVTAITAMIREAFCLFGQLVVFGIGILLIANPNISALRPGWVAISLCITGGCLTNQYRRRRHRELAETERLIAVKHGSRRISDPRALPEVR